jgi:hypothetical protein
MIEGAFQRTCFDADAHPDGGLVARQQTPNPFECSVRLEGQVRPSRNTKVRAHNERYREQRVHAQISKQRNTGPPRTSNTPPLLTTNRKGWPTTTTQTTCKAVTCVTYARTRQAKRFSYISFHSCCPHATHHCDRSAPGQISPPLPRLRQHHPGRRQSPARDQSNPLHRKVY